MRPLMSQNGGMEAMSMAGKSSNIGMGAVSQQSTSPIGAFGKSTVSPSQFLASIPGQEGAQ